MVDLFYAGLCAYCGGMLGQPKREIQKWWYGGVCCHGCFNRNLVHPVDFTHTEECRLVPVAKQDDAANLVVNLLATMRLV